MTTLFKDDDRRKEQQGQRLDGGLVTGCSGMGRYRCVEVLRAGVMEIRAHPV